MPVAKLKAPPALGGLDFEVAGELERAKSRFVAANIDRCGYLRVAFKRDGATNDLGIVVNFTLRPSRDWHRAEASIPKSALALGKGFDKKTAEAFSALAVSVGAVRIAQLFCPVPAADAVEMRELG